MRTCIQVILLSWLTAIVVGLGSDECYHYRELHDENRSWLYQPRVPIGNDTWLKTGWYRVIGSAGNVLKEGYERTYKYGSTPPYFCGSDYPGTLIGSHPSVEEGIIQMTVCFRRRWCFFENDNCDCSYTTTIYVRNCRDYFVYWLTKTGLNSRYCTTRVKLPFTPKAPVECSNYQLLTDRSRDWNNVSHTKCDSSLNGWYRFKGKAGLQIQSNCTNIKRHIRKGLRQCGATYRGWMVDRHPTEMEGRISSKVCFSYSFDCKCRFYASIYVRNCGNFFVYRFHGVPRCDSRYCGSAALLESGTTSTSHSPIIKSLILGKQDLCKSYISLPSKDRLWNNLDPMVSKCDANLYGNYRFVSSTSPMKMKEGCVVSEKFDKLSRCGSENYGWLVGIHPSEREGVVQRLVCFSRVDKPCECHTSAIVKIQNCGNFYVYGIRSVPECNARYCVDFITPYDGVINLKQKVRLLTKQSKLPKRTYSLQDRGSPSSKNDGTTVQLMSAIIIALLLVLLAAMTILILVLCRKPRRSLQQVQKVPSSTLPPYEGHRPRMSTYSVSEYSSMKSLDSHKKRRDIFRDLDKSYSDLGSRETMDTYQPILKS